MTIKLKTKMAVTHSLTAIITIFLVIVVAYVLINEHFVDYVSENQLQQQQQLAKGFETAFQGGGWDIDNVAFQGTKALEQGYLVTLKDEAGRIIWQPNNDPKIYQQEMLKIKERLRAQFGTSLRQEQFNLNSKRKRIGTLSLSYFGGFFLTNNDLRFLNHLNTSLLSIAGVSFLFAIGLASYVSNKMSQQLGSLIAQAKEMATGQLDQKQGVRNGDVKEIKELAEAIHHLQETIREKEAGNKRLTADIAHELRTPLSTMQSHLEALMDGVWQPTPERLASCHEEIIRMAAVVNNLENLKKYDAGLIELQKSNFDVNELVRNIWTNFQSDFAKKQIKFTISGQVIPIYGDREKLGQVIVNLLSNSLKYTPVGGRVLVSTQQDIEHVYIIVNDNGMGISSEDLPNIFNRLYRADVSRTRATGGAGIGLAITKAVIEAHNGQINVVSEEGKGTEFTVILPKC